MHCVDCETPLRPRGVKLADAPGTQKVQPGQRCSGCYEKAPKLGQQRATECRACERKLRPTDITLEEMPGTVTHRGGGQCTSCWRLERGVTGYRKDTRPTNCKGCEAPIRPKRASLDAYPGTIPHGAKGLCNACYQRHLKGKPVKPVRPEKCNGCAKPLRPNGTSGYEYPGTVRHVGHGMCEPCDGRARRKQAAAEKVVDLVSDPGLLRMRAEREERRRRQERAQRIRVQQERVQRQFIASRRAA